MKAVVLFFTGLAAVAAVPHDPVLRKLDDGLRYQYIQGPDGAAHLVDLWAKTSDLSEAARFNPDVENTYHLFTRQNPSVSQLILLGDTAWLPTTYFQASRPTIVLIHGWLDTMVAESNTVLIPALLEAEDVNVIAVDWSFGAGNINYAAAVVNTPVSGMKSVPVPGCTLRDGCTYLYVWLGTVFIPLKLKRSYFIQQDGKQAYDPSDGEAVARFIDWLCDASGALLSYFHLIGHNLGGHQVGIVGRNLGGQVSYITGLDPSFAGWITNDDKFQPDDGLYTEIIHTNSGLLGYLGTLAHVDFFPNGGVDMPGCISQECDHKRSFFYMAESIRRGGFSGTRCSSFVTAMAGQCFLWGSLNMGGLRPKTGQTGVYHLRTNAFPPFSRG